MALAAASSARGAVDTGVIRLNAAPPAEPSSHDDATLPDELSPARRGFDYAAFDARLEGLWFQRKAFVADGREADAARQSELIRAFVAEEGVRRLEGLAGALLAESQRYVDEGSYDKALAALSLADSLDPGRAQVRLARAAVLWKSDAGVLPSIRECLAGLKAVATAPLRNPTLLQPAALFALLGLLATVAVFSLLMVLRYQVPLRHEVEEWLAHRGYERWAQPGGIAVLLLPAVLWFATGWIALYWIGVTFRFMKNAERLAAMILLAAVAMALPSYRLAIGLYGLTADPMVRTTLAAANGVYDPDRIVKLKQLVESHPESPVYRFLLAGLYKNGRYFEEAYDQYKQVLDLAPGTYQARINIGNIFFLMGQYGEAMAQYRKAVESRPDSALAFYNMYLTQNNAFRLNESKATLDKARSLDPEQVDRLLSESRLQGDRPVVVDATVDFRSILRSTVEGRRLGEWLEAGPQESGWRSFARAAVNPLGVACLIAALGGIATVASSRSLRPARACVRCGRPFCPYCKAGRDHAEYCSQCVHLFVLGDGLAPETKTRKIYEVERYDRVSKLTRRIASIVVPGAGHILRGKVFTGIFLALVWLVGLVSWQPGWLSPVERLFGLDLRLGLLSADAVPYGYSLEALALLAVPFALAAWLAGNAGLRRPREA